MNLQVFWSQLRIKISLDNILLGNSWTFECDGIVEIVYIVCHLADYTDISNLVTILAWWRLFC